ncbi:uncharacterized protein LOC106175886 [Lingula anatina]|uniref:Uncharacterized protein LOC106175886 n=1 Tax=Lingula anatina TaxID=7574 RepID=A0A1S3JT37_LINAN|nr:uncharacterized protein LOC106175886 [Lingula anatina]|eukprot:XP_013413497.2 uncharacterized protein LOC106175886 [Lingula anatina]
MNPTGIMGIPLTGQIWVQIFLTAALAIIWCSFPVDSIKCYVCDDRLPPSNVSSRPSKNQCQDDFDRDVNRDNVEECEKGCLKTKTAHGTILVERFCSVIELQVGCQRAVIRGEPGNACFCKDRDRCNQAVAIRMGPLAGWLLCMGYLILGLWLRDGGNLDITEILRMAMSK